MTRVLSATFIHGDILKLSTVLLSGVVGLAFPDIDLRLLSVLHHRSVVTHNVFVPMLLLSAKNPDLRLAAAGLILGVSVHLAADALSRPMGFGRVWLPFPFKLSLGAFSPLWLAANALIGLVVARAVLTQAPIGASLGVYAAFAGLFALGYAVWHERSLRCFLSFALIFCLSLVAVNWLHSKPWLRPLLQAIPLMPHADPRRT